MKLQDATALLFNDALMVEECRPASFVAAELPPTAGQQASHRGEYLLRTLELIDVTRHEEREEAGNDSQLRRLEAKVDVLTSLVSGLMRARGDCDPERALSWSAAGAVLQASSPLPEGTKGVFRVQPSDRVPETLSIPATVIASDVSGTGWVIALQFDGLAPGFVEELQRHLFRVHRRSVAENRRSHA